MSKLVIYACGGTGTNIAKKIKDLDVDIHYIDTSMSNLKDVESSSTFILDGMDGAGKDQRITYEKFIGLAEDVLIKLKPSDKLNVVISSISGGSGSILAPLVSRELIKNGYNTIVIAIDSRQSIKEINNSINALKTYKALSDKIEKSISIFYVRNVERQEADNEAIYFVNLLTILTDKKHTEEFDTMDLTNFINFDKVTDNGHNVGIIEVNDNVAITPEKNTSVVSTILMTKEKNTTIKPVIPEYLTTCVVTDPNCTVEEWRVDNNLGLLFSIVEKLESELKVYVDNKKINKTKDLSVDNANKDGVVL